MNFLNSARFVLHHEGTSMQSSYAQAYTQDVKLSLDRMSLIWVIRKFPPQGFQQAFKGLGSQGTRGLRLQQRKIVKEDPPKEFAEHASYVPEAPGNSVESKNAGTGSEGKAVADEVHWPACAVMVNHQNSKRSGLKADRDLLVGF